MDGFDWPRWGCHAGIVSPIAFLVFTMIAIANYPSYTPVSNYLSDLGIGSASSFFFNSGVIISGACGSVFAISLFQRSRSLSGRIGSLALFIGLLSFMMIAYFTEMDFLFHEIFAGGFFFLSAVSFVLIGLERKRENATLGYFSIAMSMPVIYFMLSGLAPFPEHIAVLSVLAWSSIMAVSGIRAIKTATLKPSHMP